MFSYIDDLKQLIANIEICGDTIERCLPSAELIQKLREFAMTKLFESNTESAKSLLDEWLVQPH